MTSPSSQEMDWDDLVDGVRETEDDNGTCLIPVDEEVDDTVLRQVDRIHNLITQRIHNIIQNPRSRNAKIPHGFTIEANHFQITETVLLQNGNIRCKTNIVCDQCNKRVVVTISKKRLMIRCAGRKPCPEWRARRVDDFIDLLDVMYQKAGRGALLNRTNDTGFASQFCRFLSTMQRPSDIFFAKTILDKISPASPLRAKWTFVRPNNDDRVQRRGRGGGRARQKRNDKSTNELFTEWLLTKLKFVRDEIYQEQSRPTTTRPRSDELDTVLADIVAAQEKIEIINKFNSDGFATQLLTRLSQLQKDILRDVIFRSFPHKEKYISLYHLCGKYHLFQNILKGLPECYGRDMSIVNYEAIRTAPQAEQQFGHTYLTGMLHYVKREIIELLKDLMENDEMSQRVVNERSRSTILDSVREIRSAIQRCNQSNTAGTNAPWRAIESPTFEDENITFTYPIYTYNQLIHGIFPQTEQKIECFSKHWFGFDQTDVVKLDKIIHETLIEFAQRESDIRNFQDRMHTEQEIGLSMGEEMSALYDIKFDRIVAFFSPIKSHGVFDLLKGLQPFHMSLLIKLCIFELIHAEKVLDSSLNVWSHNERDALECTGLLDTFVDQIFLEHDQWALGTTHRDELMKLLTKDELLPTLTRNTELIQFKNGYLHTHLCIFIPLESITDDFGLKYIPFPLSVQKEDFPIHVYERDGLCKLVKTQVPNIDCFIKYYSFIFAPSWDVEPMYVRGMQQRRQYTLPPNLCKKILTRVVEQELVPDPIFVPDDYKYQRDASEDDHPATSKIFMQQKWSFMTVFWYLAMAAKLYVLNGSKWGLATAAIGESHVGKSTLFFAIARYFPKVDMWNLGGEFKNKHSLAGGVRDTAGTEKDPMKIAKHLRMVAFNDEFHRIPVSIETVQQLVDIIPVLIDLKYGGQLRAPVPVSVWFNGNDLPKEAYTSTETSQMDALLNRLVIFPFNQPVYEQGNLAWKDRIKNENTFLFGKSLICYRILYDILYYQRSVISCKNLQPHQCQVAKLRLMQKYFNMKKARQNNKLKSAMDVQKYQDVIERLRFEGDNVDFEQEFEPAPTRPRIAEETTPGPQQTVPVNLSNLIQQVLQQNLTQILQTTSQPTEQTRARKRQRQNN